MDIGSIAQIAGQALAAFAATLAVRSRQQSPEPAALPAHVEAPRVECACDEGAIARAVAAALEERVSDERVKALVSQAVYSMAGVIDRSHKKLDTLDELARLVVVLSERTAHIAATVEAIRSQREQITPPLGLKR